MTSIIGIRGKNLKKKTCKKKEESKSYKKKVNNITFLAVVFYGVFWLSQTGVFSLSKLLPLNATMICLIFICNIGAKKSKYDQVRKIYFMIIEATIVTSCFGSSVTFSFIIGGNIPTYCFITILIGITIAWKMANTKYRQNESNNSSISSKKIGLITIFSSLGIAIGNIFARMGSQDQINTFIVLCFVIIGTMFCFVFLCDIHEYLTIKRQDIKLR